MLVFLTLRGFNPTLVRLRRATDPAHRCASRSSFNPTLVRLRPAQEMERRLDMMRFQSHAGSIEARLPQQAPQLGLRGFNPTLVRLRPDAYIEFTSREKTFQSHAGSIEARRIHRVHVEVKNVSIPRWFD